MKMRIFTLSILAFLIQALLHKCSEDFTSPYIISFQGIWSVDVSNIRTNAYFFWHNYPATLPATVISVAGILALLPQLLFERGVYQVPLQFLSVVSILHVAGLDFLHIWGMVTFFLILRIRQSDSFDTFELLVTGFFSFLISGPASIFWILFGLYFSPDGKPASKRTCALLTLIPFLLSLIYPTPTWHHYPEGATVVLDDGISGLLRPYWGPLSPNVQIIHRLREKELWYFPSILLLAGTGVLSLLTREKRLLIPALALACDILLPERFAQIGPLAVARRIVPYAFFLPLPSLIASFLMLRVALCYKQITTQIVACMLLLILQFMVPTTRVLPGTNISASPSVDIELRKSESIAPANSLENFKTVQAGRYRVETNLQGDPAQLTDRRSSTKIFSTTQKGTEFVKLLFKSPVTVQGVKLSTGVFFTDYARELSIEDCESQRMIIRPLRWLGTLKETRQGKLYYESQAAPEQLLQFKRAVTTSCLLIRQTGKEDYFDWSLSELRIFSVKKNSP